MNEEKFFAAFTFFVHSESSQRVTPKNKTIIVFFTPLKSYKHLSTNLIILARSF